MQTFLKEEHALNSKGSSECYKTTHKTSSPAISNEIWWRKFKAMFILEQQLFYRHAHYSSNNWEKLGGKSILIGMLVRW